MKATLSTSSGMLISCGIAFAVWRSPRGRVVRTLRLGRRRDLHIWAEVGDWAVAYARLGERAQQGVPDKLRIWRRIRTDRSANKQSRGVQLGLASNVLAADLVYYLN